MITADFYKENDTLRLCVSGHADYAESGGDIVCAGVSALLYGFVAYLRETLPIATAEDFHPKGRAPLWEVSEGDGRLWVRTHGSDGRDKAAFASIEAGLRLIAACYPHHVTLDTDTKGDTYESS
jgi:uncharacterized protein YsxB (DUF464 family)